MLLLLLHCANYTGTDAWIDALGYLRETHYIADKDGYRIMKDKTTYVGQNRPIKVFKSHVIYQIDNFNFSRI